ncbi:MAG: zf-TFIIB domain-containing protein [Desulfuromusa sp.]|jgi:Zn-finger nucleic acid-binding protein|nr:zf-TFIIB domain-containing protein [Desulfuromusa sp.]
MTDAWDDRKKALENEYFHKKEREALAKMKQAEIEAASLGHCPKCGKVIEPITFHGVPLDQCPDCGGVWLGPNDLKILAAKDHRTWFERWFNRDDENSN